MKRNTPTQATVVATGLFVGGLVCGALAGRAAVARVQDPYAHLDLFARVLTTIQQDYVEEIPPEELIDAAIEGMVARLDRQSRWLDSGQLQDLKDDAEGATTGLGIEVQPLGEGVEVVRVVDGSPAERDGLVAGDRIIEVDGHALAGLQMEQVREQFSGARGEHATLTVIREGWDEPRRIDTTRDRVRREVVSGELLRTDVAYVHLAQFQEGSAADIEAEVEYLSRHLGGPAQLAGLVLDLRDNPGGLLTEAVAVSDLFLDEGVIVSTRGRKSDNAAESHEATVGGFPADLPVVVLINGMSASASEIVAGALQDTHRAVLVGEHSYGKGTVQQVYLHSSPEESALKLTVGRYYTPSGEPVAPKEGRVPDHIVPYPTPSTAAQALRERLAALQVDAAEREELLALVAELPHPDPGRPVIPWDQPVGDRVDDDPQLRRALELLP